MSSELIVRLTSFSYKRSLPSDDTEHGGGFMFDCRCLPNPGRQEFFRSKTGLEKEVIEFLEKEEEVQRYYSTVETLISQAVEKYISRGFSHLMVSFGCTGGQHRSVYCTERIRNHLVATYAVSVEVDHKGLKELGYI